MRAFCIFVALSLPACGLAQGVMVTGGFGGSSGGGTSTISGSGGIIGGGGGTMPRGNPIGTGNLQVDLRTDSQPIRRGLTTSYRGRSGTGTSYFTRTVMDSVKHEYFGYELLLEEQQPGTYRATFGPLPVTTMEMASMGAPAKEWSMRAPALPESKIVHDGDVISVELMSDVATGEKLIEDITIQHYSPGPVMTGLTGGINRAGQAPARAVPTVEGPARDFTAQDAEMRLALPRITLNGIEQSDAAGSQRGVLLQPPNLLNRNASGPLVWFYLPGRGRYILSLVAQPELDFQKAGELRGGLIKFTLDQDRFTLECPVEITTGHAPYNLYLLHDPLYEPTSQRQKGQSAIGSVGVEELAALKRQ